MTKKNVNGSMRWISLRVSGNGDISVLPLTGHLPFDTHETKTNWHLRKWECQIDASGKGRRMRISRMDWERKWRRRRWRRRKRRRRKRKRRRCRRRS